MVSAWRGASLCFYLAGGCLFLSGSVFYYTGDHHNTIGGWLFAAGGVAFLVCEPINIFILDSRPDGPREVVLLLTSLSGTLIYFAGCILFIPQLHRVDLGTWLFIIGSACFIAVSATNVIRGCSTGF